MCRRVQDEEQLAMYREMRDATKSSYRSGPLRDPLDVRIRLKLAPGL
jgi:hypothetical protein